MTHHTALRAKRVSIMGGLGGLFGGLVSAALLSLYPLVLLPASRTSNVASRFTVTGRLMQAWLAHRDFLPWVSTPHLFNVTGAPDLPLIWLGCALVSALFLGAKAWGKDAPSEFGGPSASGAGEHGTARWRNVSELSETFSWFQPGAKKGGVPVPSGLYVGQASASPPAAWVHAREGHTLLIGSTGSGKSRRVILPSIAVIGSARKESLVISDPKGELYAYTADWLRSQGYRIIRYDLREPSRGNRYNPIGPVVQALAEGRRDQASAMAWDIAHLLAGASADAQASGGDKFWTDTAESLISALILAISQGQPPGQPRPPEDDAPWTWATAEQQHMSSVYSTLLAGGGNGLRLDDLFGQFPLSHPARQAYGPVALSQDKTRSGILTTAISALRLFADQSIAWLTATSDHNPADAGTRLTATFLVIPDDRSTMYPLATLYIQQMLQNLTRVADAHGGKLPVPVVFLLDEFGNLPQIRDFDKVVTVSRGRGIRLCLAVQDTQQLQRHYRNADATIKGNLSTWLYLSTADNTTADEISRKMGDYTTTVQNLSVPRVTWWTSSATVGTASTTHSLQRRPLLTAEEILRWPKGQALVLQSGQHPAKLALPDLSEWKSVWPAIQEPAAAPAVQAIQPPPIWTPPALDGEIRPEELVQGEDAAQTVRPPVEDSLGSSALQTQSDEEGGGWIAKSPAPGPERDD